MKLLTQVFLAILLLPVTLSAQNATTSPQLSGEGRASGPMIRKGWFSATDREVRPVNNPSTGANSSVNPETDNAGYWKDLEAEGAVILHFSEGSSRFAQDYGNAQAITVLDRMFYDTDLLSNIEFITITAASSPEGSSAANEKLAIARAAAIKDYIAKRYPYIDSNRILTFSAGEDWRGLRNMIEDDPNTPGREDALLLLNSLLQGDAMRARLKQIAGGTTYTYISKHMFPVLRGGAACMVYLKDGSY